MSMAQSQTLCRRCPRNAEPHDSGMCSTPTGLHTFQLLAGTACLVTALGLRVPCTAIDWRHPLGNLGPGSAV